MLVSDLSPVLTVAPAELAVTLAQAKAHLRVDYTVDDDSIVIYVSAAIARLDGWAGILGRCLVTQTWRQDFAGFDDRMALPFPDVASVTVTYRDAANAVQTLASTNYQLVNGRGRSWIEIAEGGSWPGSYDRPDAVSVAMVCGYGAAAAVPAPLKAAILLHVGVQFGNRADGELPPAYDALIAPYRRVGL